MLLQEIDWIVKRQPLGNANCKLSFAFELLEHLEIVPLIIAVGTVGKILDGGHARTRYVLQRGFNRPASLVISWWRNNARHHGLRTFAQNPIRLLGRIAPDLTAWGRFARQGNVRQLEREGVCHRYMAVGAHDKDGVIGRDLIDVPSGRKFFYWPQGL